jgi:hypothetical protein
VCFNCVFKLNRPTSSVTYGCAAGSEPEIEPELELASDSEDSRAPGPVLVCDCFVDVMVTLVYRDCDHLELELRCRLRFAKGLGPPLAGPFSGLG